MTAMWATRRTRRVQTKAAGFDEATCESLPYGKRGLRG
jgi:hypothetical protein